MFKPSVAAKTKIGPENFGILHSVRFNVADKQFPVVVQFEIQLYHYPIPALLRDSEAATTIERVSALARQIAFRIQLVRALEMFFGQLSHTEVLKTAPNHPMVKGIIRRELVGLPFMTAGFFEFA